MNRSSELLQQDQQQELLHHSDMDSDRSLDSQDIVQHSEYPDGYYDQQYAYAEGYGHQADTEREGYESDQESVDYQHEPYSSSYTDYDGQYQQGDHQNGNTLFQYYDPVTAGEDSNRNDATPLRETSDPYQSDPYQSHVAATTRPQPLVRHISTLFLSLFSLFFLVGHDYHYNT